VRNNAAQGFFKTLDTIDQEKQKLIAYDNFKNVEVDSIAGEMGLNIQDLKKDSQTDEKIKTLTKYLMFPTKRKVVHEMRKSLGFFNQQFHFQISSLGRSLGMKLSDSQASLCSEMQEIHQIEVRFWESALERAIDAMGVSELS
jgi:hypothetical protein